MRTVEWGWLFAVMALVVAGCVAPADDGEDEEAVEEGEALSGSPAAIDVGFNGGPDQFDVWDDFLRAEGGRRGPRLCHTYLDWRVADEPASAADANARKGSRPWFEAFLARAKDACDEVLVSFKSPAAGRAPSEHQFAHAFGKFLDTPWHARTGYAGKFAIAAWNEPNNGADDGNGLGKPIEPELAARYYLSAERLCEAHGCTVVAGDFASNGGFWNDYEFNCPANDVERSNPARCKNPTPLAHGHAPSYLDRYKAVIERAGVRPAAFAYHGWHDVNAYLNTKDHCSDYEHCTTRRVLRNLSGSWGKVAIWDTEVGVGQFEAPNDHDQACGAAFMLRLHAKPSPRITRIYYTHLRGGAGHLYDGATARPAAQVLARRESTYAGGRCP